MLTKHLLLTSAAAMFAISTAFAQESGGTTETQDPAAQVPQPPPATATEPAAPAEGTAEAQPVSPPPSDAIISAQGANEMRADSLIGMTVYNTAGEEVGQVKDILVDQDGKATGVVLSIGGVLGIGAKSVGLVWDEVDVKPEERMVQIGYSKEQLDAAPTFKTQEEQQAESQAQQMQTQTPPATGTTTTQ